MVRPSAGQGRTVNSLLARPMCRYRNRWVALVYSRVVAHGESLKEVRDEVEKKKIKGYVFDFVSPLPFVGYAL